mmetsp:Transcript_22158/g.30848  ORF Transcript_22158/g.30848 Transcript_22158/m.30848 type:complete len:112 (-) Transcript_22158:201-536(-)
MTETAPKPEFITAVETEITVEFPAVGDVTEYELEWKPYPASWETGSKSKNVSVSGKKTKATVTDLEPGTTYCIRLACKDATGRAGEPSQELIVDTEQVGCTPQQKSCCTVS